MNSTQWFNKYDPSFQQLQEENCKNNRPIPARENTRFEELTLKYAQAEQEIKKLNHIIEKLNQREKNGILYFQTKLLELQKINEGYQIRIQSFEGQKEKYIKRGNGNKLNKSINKSFNQSSMKKSNFDNKENNNLLNLTEELFCENPLCQAKIQLQKLKKSCIQVTNSLENILYSIKIRQISQWNINDYEKWSKSLQMQRNKKKYDCNKNSLLLLKNLQQKINQIKYHIEQPSKHQNIVQPLVESLKVLKAKHTNLMKVPYLQKVDVIQRKQDYDCLVEDSKAKKQRIFQMLKQR